MQGLQKFIESSSRNKLVIIRCYSYHIESINIGEILSIKIKKFTEDKKLPLRAKDILEGIFSESLFNSNVFGKYLAFENVGILFEPELKIDFLSLLDKFSRDNPLFIQWDGEIENDCLYFLSKQDEIKINIKDLSHIII